jgi:hypothetical protein
MASFYNIVHKTDKSFAPFHASTYAYVCQLFMAIQDIRPELSGHLEIVAVTSEEPKTSKTAPDRPWYCSVV